MTGPREYGGSCGAGAKTNTGIALDFDSWLPVRRFVPMQEATQIARDKTIRNKMVRKMAASQDKKGNPLRVYAYAIFTEDSFLIGNPPHSHVFERVPNIERDRCGFSGDGSAITRRSEAAPLYSNIYVAAYSMKKRIREMKRW